ncbi:hypothetical protein CLIB1444_08S00452 [[Candida] jaroonii]|uniref:Uncharacterized protein n=1 Tax=[Candida] jaroonii TaxID=467808 RepID=A0ACA9YAG5_9ASCO|nr:hypothetical protein CLIB1444_08S00452 [[Candida] jaroonii]
MYPTPINFSTMTLTFQDLSDRAIRLFEEKKERVIIGVAGIPGSGKSTVTEAVGKIINKSHKCVVVGLDGFHYTREYLRSLENSEEAFIRRGAHFTFDAKSCVEFVKSLRARTTISAPSFDHKLKDPVNNGTIIPGEAEILLVEGLYVLLNIDPWNQISQYLDDSWFINVDLDVARDRVAKRHVEAGIEPTIEKAYQRVDSNDIINAHLIMDNSIPANLII